MVKQIASSDDYKRIADEVLEKLAGELVKKPEFMENFKEEAEKLKSGYFKSTRGKDKETP